MNIRAGLLAGFGALLTLWLLCGFYTVARIAEAERRLNSLNASFTHNEELLLALRYNIPMAAVYLRDNLLDFGDDAPEYYGKRLADSRKEVELALAAYVPMIDSAAERENWAQLKAELDDYWAAITPAMQWDNDQKEFLSRRYLRQNVIRKRNLILRISERIQALNRSAFQQRQQEIRRSYAALKRRIWWTGAGSALLGLLVAVAVIIHAGRLEKQILQQHAQDERNKSDLRRLSAQLVQVQEKERTKLARELHDEVGQAITALKMELAFVERKLGAGESRATLAEARAIADHTLETVRDMSRLLHPAMLDDLGLPETVRWYLNSFSKRTSIAAELAVGGLQVRLPAETELTGYRIVQEALTNISRHAAATRVRILLARQPSELVVCVEDNGKGFDPRQRPSGGVGGLGLIGIKERIAAMGGSFWLDTAPGRGTRLRAELPAPDSGLQIADCGFQKQEHRIHAKVANIAG